MKLRMFLLSLVCCTFVNAGPTTLAETNPTPAPTPTPSAKHDWREVIWFIHPGQKLYYDHTSLSRNKVDDSDFSSGTFLLVYNNPVEVDHDGKKFKIKSSLRMAVLECNTRLLAPIFDLFYTKAFPEPGDDFVFMKAYGSHPSNYAVVTTNAPIYSVLCPTSV